MVTEPSTDAEIEDEVTRIDEVRHLAGASGHSVLSLLFLVLSGLLVLADARRIAWVTLVIAYGVVLNGLSIYAWDRLRARIASVVERPDGADRRRALTPHRLSAGTKAQLGAGLVITGVLIVSIASLFEVLTLLGPRAGFVLLVGALALANLGALGRTYYASRG